MAQNPDKTESQPNSRRDIVRSPLKAKSAKKGIAKMFGQESKAASTQTAVSPARMRKIAALKRKLKERKARLGNSEISSPSRRPPASRELIGFSSPNPGTSAIDDAPNPESPKFARRPPPPPPPEAASPRPSASFTFNMPSSQFASFTTNAGHHNHSTNQSEFLNDESVQNDESVHLTQNNDNSVTNVMEIDEE